MLSKFSRVRLTLPAPTGPYPPGMVALHLTDYSRRNPWAASPSYRELMGAVRAEQAYLSAFFGRFLRSQDDHLLDSPSPRYPQFAFVQ